MTFEGGGADQSIEQRIQAACQQGGLPRHIAVIMDGNGRWAQKHSRPRLWGHRRGVASVRETVEVCAQLGIEALSLYAFSEENWGRPTTEISGIMGLLDTYIVREREELDRNNIRLRISGRLEALPKKSQNLVRETVSALSSNDGMILNIALSYSARAEIAFACRALIEKAQKGEIQPDEVDPDLIEQLLWTVGLPDPDLLIRTSGEQRISNFLLWQIAYAELWFTPIHWPEFRKANLLDAVENYRSRKRRYGLVEAPENSESARSQM